MQDSIVNCNIMTKSSMIQCEISSAVNFACTIIRRDLLLEADEE